ncbi:hypothetical protein V2J09_007420 [Rumex salicifolius]
MPRSSDRRSKYRPIPNSSPEDTPPRYLNTAAKHENHRRLEIVTAASAARPFQLPDGWLVEVKHRPRSSINQTPDKYYYEPYTGKRFRSLVSVKRYLDGEQEPVPFSKASKTEDDGAMNLEVVRRIVYNGKMWKPDELEVARRSEDVIPTAVQHKLSSELPDGWIVEDVPRTHGLKSDRFFLEPLTGMKFQSVPEVRSYLTDEIVKLEHFDISNPPEKVNWRLISSSGEDHWRAYVEESRIPDHVKKLWHDTFFLGMTSRKKEIPQLTMGDEADSV